MTAISSAPARAGRRTGDSLLRLALRLDAAGSGAMGLALAAGAGVLDRVLGVPPGWLLALGAALIGYAGALLWLAARPVIPAAAGWTVVVGNLGWVLVSAAAVLLGWFPFTTAGTVLAVGQAVAVAAVADVQAVAVRRRTS